MLILNYFLKLDSSLNEPPTDIMTLLPPATDLPGSVKFQTKLHAIENDDVIEANKNLTQDAKFMKGIQNRPLNETPDLRITQIRGSRQVTPQREPLQQVRLKLIISIYLNIMF